MELIAIIAVLVIGGVFFVLRGNGSRSRDYDHDYDRYDDDNDRDDDSGDDGGSDD